MKYFIFTLLMLISLLAKSQAKYDEFLEFAKKHFDPPESVQRMCFWQYAIIKLDINKENKVVSYKVMNTVAEGITGSLLYLKDYSFNKNLHFNQRSVIFCLGIENMRTGDCDTIKTGGHPRALEELRRYQHAHRYEERHSIFIYKEALKIIEDKVN